MTYVRTPWDDFPKVRVLYPLGTLKRADEKLYIEAKSGDMEAAFKLLYRNVLKEKDVYDLGVRLFKYKPILVPVIAKERLGNNRIPMAFANILSGYLGFEFNDDIVQSVKANHTDAGAYERIVRQPLFEGEVQEGRNYVILDDTVSMGGTLAALKGYIENNGGKVVLACTLTGFLVPEIDLVPLEKTLDFVMRKHPQLAEWWLYEFNFPIQYLTQGELGHFKKPASIDEIRNRLIEAGFKSRNENS
ncbi:phosphoribosyltransferase [Acinetobacter baumannii]